MAEGYVRQKEFEESVIQIKRVSKKTKGGNNISFTALVVVGDKKGKVGSALGRAKDVADAIRKGIEKAKDNLIEVNLKENTIPHEVSAKHKAAKILMKPAPKGTGIIAGGSVRNVLELVGVEDVSSKILGSSNKQANIMCTLKALESLKEVK